MKFCLLKWCTILKFTVVMTLNCSGFGSKLRLQNAGQLSVATDNCVSVMKKNVKFRAIEVVVHRQEILFEIDDFVEGIM